jgi:hypothetical protein
MSEETENVIEATNTIISEETPKKLINQKRKKLRKK